MNYLSSLTLDFSDCDVINIEGFGNALSQLISLTLLELKFSYNYIESINEFGMDFSNLN